jgi:hypothetical protein
MKKLTTLAVLSLMFLGCEESGSPSSAKVLTPADEVVAPNPEPVANPAPIFKVVTFKFTTSEPTNYQIRIEKYVESVGYDYANPVLINRTTTQNTSLLSVDVLYKSRIYIIKDQSASISLIDVDFDSQVLLRKELGTGFSIETIYAPQEPAL